MVAGTVGRGTDSVNTLIMSNSKNIQSDNQAFVKFLMPNPSLLGWMGGCGNMYCTGFKNVLLTDWTGDLFGNIS